MSSVDEEDDRAGLVNEIAYQEAQVSALRQGLQAVHLNLAASERYTRLLESALVSAAGSRPLESTDKFASWLLTVPNTAQNQALRAALVETSRVSETTRRALAQLEGAPEERLSDLSPYMVMARADIDALKRKAAESEAQAARFAKDAEAARAESGPKVDPGIAERKLAELEARLCEAEEELCAQDELLAAGDEKFAALDAERLATEGRLRETAGLLGEAESKLAELESQLGEMRHRLGEKERKLEETERKLGETERKLGETERKLHEEERKLEEEQQKLEETEHSLREAEGRLREQVPDPSRARSEVRELQAQLRSAEQALRAAEQATRAAEERNRALPRASPAGAASSDTQLEQDLALARQDLAAAREDRVRGQEDVARVRAELERAQAELEVLRRGAAARGSEEAQAVRSQVVAAADEANLARAAAEQARRENAGLRQRLETVAQELATVTAAYAEVESELEAARVAKDKLTRRVAFEKEQKEIAKAEYEAAKAQWLAEAGELREMSTEALKRQLKFKDDTIARLQDDLEHLRASLAAVRLDSSVLGSPDAAAGGGAEVAAMVGRLRDEHRAARALWDQELARTSEELARARKLLEEARREHGYAASGGALAGANTSMASSTHGTVHSRLVLLPRANGGATPGPGGHASGPAPTAPRSLGYALDEAAGAASFAGPADPPGALAELRGMYADLQNLTNRKLREGEAERTALRAERDAVERSLHEAVAERDRLERELAEARREHASTVAGLRERDAGDARRSQELHDAADQLDRFQSAIREQSSELASARDRISALEGRLLKLGLDPEEDSKDSAMGTPTRVARLETLVSDLKRQLHEQAEAGRERDSALALYEHQQGKFRARAQDAEAHAEGLAARIAELERKEREKRLLYDHLSREKSDEQRRRADAEATMTALRTDLENAHRQLMSLEASRSATDVDLSNARARCAELEAYSRRVPELQEVREALEAQLEGRAALVAQAREEVTRLQGVIAAKEQARAEAEAALAAVEEEAAGAHQTIAGLKDAVKRLEGELRERAALIASMEGLNDTLKDEVQQLERRLVGMAEREKEALRQQQLLANQAEAYCKEAYTELQQCQAERERAVGEREASLRELAAELEAVTRTRSEVQAQLRSATGAHEAERADMAARITSLEVQARAHAAELSQTVATLAKADGARRELEAALRRVDAERAQWEDRYREAKRNLSEGLREAEGRHAQEEAALRRQVEEAKTGRDILLEELQSNIAAGQDRQARLDLCERLLGEKTEENETLSQHVTAFAAELQRAAELLKARDRLLKEQALELESAGQQGSLHLSATVAKLDEMRKHLADRDRRCQALETEVQRLQQSLGPLFGTLGNIWQRLQMNQSKH